MRFHTWQNKTHKSTKRINKSVTNEFESLIGFVSRDFHMLHKFIRKIQKSRIEISIFHKNFVTFYAKKEKFRTNNFKRIEKKYQESYQNKITAAVEFLL